MKNIFQIFIEDVGFKVQNDLSESQLLNSKVFNDLKPLVHNGRYRSYWASRPHQIHGCPFYLRFYFEDSEFKSFQLNNAIEEGSHDDLRNHSQLENAKKINDKWLMDQLGITEKRNEPWGSVESVLDKKSWSASIIFRFSVT